MREIPAQKRRFIAGVTCPSCGELDKIYVTEEAGEEMLRCNACDYRESRERKGGAWQPVRLPGSGEKQD